MNKKMQIGIGSIIAVIFTVVGTMITGGSTGPMLVKYKNCSYTYEYEQAQALIPMIESCKLQKLGDKCEVKVGVTIVKLQCDDVIETLSTIGTTTEQPSPTKVEEVKPAVVEPVKTEGAKPEEVKPVEVKHE